MSATFHQPDAGRAPAAKSRFSTSYPSRAAGRFAVRQSFSRDAIVHAQFRSPAAAAFGQPLRRRRWLQLDAEPTCSDWLLRPDRLDVIVNKNPPFRHGARLPKQIFMVGHGDLSSLDCGLGAPLARSGHARRPGRSSPRG